VAEGRMRDSRSNNPASLREFPGSEGHRTRRD